MIIRSQDKEVIANLNNIDSICIEHNVCEFDVVCYNGLRDSSLKISAYSTEEKAIKVLDMICKAYENYRGGNVYEHSIFNMPSDEEVEV